MVTIGWYGKLPGRGDFVGRGLPWRADWDAWLQRGFAHAGVALGGAELRRRLANFAPWRYWIAPGDGPAWCGIVAPSYDRVGRTFPLTLAQPLRDPGQAAECAARLATLLDAALDGPDELEAGIGDLEPFLADPPAADPPTPPIGLWWPLAAPADTAPVESPWPPLPTLWAELLTAPPP